MGSSVPGPGEPPFLIRQQLLCGPLTADDPPHDYFADCSGIGKTCAVALYYFCEIDMNSPIIQFGAQRD